jgi:hypothetical protein
MEGVKWSKAEKVIARRAFDLAYQRECFAIASKVREMASAIKEPRDIWRIHDFLTDQRTKTDGKYDYRHSVLAFVFATLLREGWLTEADLVGLSEEKLARIKFVATL